MKSGLQAYMKLARHPSASRALNPLTFQPETLMIGLGMRPSPVGQQSVVGGWLAVSPLSDILLIVVAENRVLMRRNIKNIIQLYWRNCRFNLEPIKYADSL
jgi:hypothetical protein